MFVVDVKGLRQIIERKGKGFALLEVIQNAWDQNVTRVNITFTKEPGERRAYLRVEDDDPEGFADLRHAYTLFAPSIKKTDPTKRGRFNIGEKLVIALCVFARITTTKGGLEFADGKRTTLRRKTERGSVFEGEIVMTNAEYEECCDLIQQILPPVGIDTYFNDQLLARREPFKVVTNHPLRTEIADEEGYLRGTTRQTTVMIYKVLPGETGTLYEMGIPVVDTDDDFHVDVQQKIPLTMDRENVPPAYRRAIRTLVLNEVSRDLTEATAAHTWVDEAMESPDVDAGAVKDVIRHRFGENAVIYDPSDREANSRATAAGHTVVAGGSLSGGIWENVRRFGVLLPAGRVFPTHPEKGKNSPDIEPRKDEIATINAIIRLCRELMGFPVQVRLISDAAIGAQAMYGGRCLTFNKIHLPGGRKFLTSGMTEPVVDLVIHELGHEKESNHLSDSYNNELTRLGAKLAFLVKDDPTLLVA